MTRKKFVSPFSGQAYLFSEQSVGEFVQFAAVLSHTYDYFSRLYNKLVTVSSCTSVCFCVLFLHLNVKPRYISWPLRCQTESVGGDIHRGAFSGTFMRDFFHG